MHLRRTTLPLNLNNGILSCLLLLSALALSHVEVDAAPTESNRYVYEGSPKFAYGFSSHMVLQRDTPVNVWGFASPGESVTVSIDGKRARGQADQYGQWLVALDAMPAGGPYTLTLESGDTDVELEDVLLGDIWICSGQSNMRYGLDRQDKDKNYIYADELAAIQAQTEFPIRHAMGDDKELKWHEVDYETVTSKKKNRAGVTAVGYYFAKRLREDLGDVPIGIIQTGAGGKAIRHFIPKDVQWNDPELKSLWFGPHFSGVSYWDQLIKKHGEETLKQHEAAVNAWMNGETASEVCPVYISNYPGYLYIKSIPPLKNLKFKGMVWYQGESDASRFVEYPYHLEVLIDHYRDFFNYPDMPFITIMLPPYKSKRYPAFTNAQLTMADRKVGVFASYAPEAGDEKDIHPPRKEIIGERAGLTALAEVYGAAEDSLGPRFDRASIRGGVLQLDFKNVKGGLKLADGVTELTGFEISGSDGEWTPMSAEISSNQQHVEITIPESLSSKTSLGVQFNWKPYYVPVLYGMNDLPAIPFQAEVSNH